MEGAFNRLQFWPQTERHGIPDPPLFVCVCDYGITQVHVFTLQIFLFRLQLIRTSAVRTIACLCWCRNRRCEISVVILRFKVTLYNSLRTNRAFVFFDLE